ncbi:hypothetical protein GCM10009804_18530 [Kribbella hippodromi]|uniref:Phthiocerol/phthiodiolone dimycocerosyl transferase n=1 Tax=Kribbella hippodromi TaxID=434347 RepID=A0ABP4NHY0_9ACTN
MQQQRDLDYAEVLMKPLTATVAVSYRGQLDIESLVAAYRQLCCRHSILSARIHAKDAGFELSVGDDPNPKLSVLTGDEETLWDTARGSWDDTEGVVQLIVVHAENRGYIAIRHSHAIMDGGVTFPLLSELWAIYTDLAAGRPMQNVARDELSIGPADLLSTRWTETSPIPVPQPAEVPADSGSGAFDPGVSRRLTLSEKDTDRLLGVARAQSVTVGGLLTGATVLATTKLTGPPPSGIVTILAGIDLRRHLEPPVPVTRTANLYGRSIADVNAGPDATATSIAREVNDQQRAALRTRNLEIAGVDNPGYQPRTLAGYFIVNNYGILPSFPPSGSVRIVDFTVMPAVDMSAAQFYYQRFYTFDGRINSFMTYPSRFSGEPIELVVANFLRELTAITGTTPELADKDFHRY